MRYRTGYREDFFLSVISVCDIRDIMMASRIFPEYRQPKKNEAAGQSFSPDAPGTVRRTAAAGFLRICQKKRISTGRYTASEKETEYV